MSSPSQNVWLSRFAVLTAVSTLFLICVGGLVTSHGVGMAVPDWPNTYGYNMFFFPFSQWVGGIFYEHSHRLIGSLVGLLTTILSIWFWSRETKGSSRWLGIGAIVFGIVLMGVRVQPVYIAISVVSPIVIAFSLVQVKRNPGTFRWWGMIAFAAVLLQGILGGFRVVFLKDEIGILHGTLAQAFFVLVCLLALTQTKWWSGLARNAVKDTGGLRKIYLFVALLILSQLVLGATMRHQHAGLAIPDFPLAYGKVWPDMSPEAIAQYNQARLEVKSYHAITAFQVGLQMVHRIVALLILLAVVACVWLTKKQLGWQTPLAKFSIGLMLVIFLQVFLGAATIWTNKSADVATAHVAIGALSLMLASMMTLISRRVLAPIDSQTTSVQDAPLIPVGLASK